MVINHFLKFIKKGDKFNYSSPFFIVIKYLFLTFISYLSWNYNGFLFFIYGYFLFDHLNQVRSTNFKEYFIKIVVLLSTWHFGALFWLFEVDKGVFALLANLTMYVTFFAVLYFILRKSRIIFFIPLFILFEYMLEMINISLPWLILGNVFSNTTSFIQWYEYSGVLGGSFWFLIISFLLFKLTKKNYYKISLSLIIPILLSFLLNYRVKTPERFKKIVLYNPEFTNKSLQNYEYATYISQKIANIEGVQSLIIPESTFRGIQMNTFEKTIVFKEFKEAINNSSLSEIYFGTTLLWSKKYIANGGILMNGSEYYFKVKKKLIPFNEYLPTWIRSYFPEKKILFEYDIKDMEQIIINKQNIIPLVCYESFYSSFVANKFSDSKAIYLISSEKFLNNSYYGKKQYDNIIRLRSIENRIPLVKCSSYGNSIIINSRGNHVQKDNKEFNVFLLPISKNGQTFYSKFNKFIPPVGIIIFLIFLLFPNLKPKKNSQRTSD